MKHLLILLTLSFTALGDPQADKLFEDYFEWKIDTFKVSSFSIALYPIHIFFFSAILLPDWI